MARRRLWRNDVVKVILATRAIHSSDFSAEKNPCRQREELGSERKCLVPYSENKGLRRVPETFSFNRYNSTLAFERFGERYTKHAKLKSAAYLVQ